MKTNVSLHVEHAHCVVASATVWMKTNVSLHVEHAHCVVASATVWMKTNVSLHDLWYGHLCFCSGGASVTVTALPWNSTLCSTLRLSGRNKPVCCTTHHSALCKQSLGKTIKTFLTEWCLLRTHTHVRMHTPTHTCMNSPTCTPTHPSGPIHAHTHPVFFDLKTFSGGAYLPSATSHTISFFLFPIVFSISNSAVFSEMSKFWKKHWHHEQNSRRVQSLKKRSLQTSIVDQINLTIISWS